MAPVRPFFPGPGKTRGAGCPANPRVRTLPGWQRFGVNQFETSSLSWLDLAAVRCRARFPYGLLNAVSGVIRDHDLDLNLRPADVAVVSSVRQVEKQTTD